MLPAFPTERCGTSASGGSLAPVRRQTARFRMFKIVLSSTIFSVLGRGRRNRQPCRLSVCVYNDAKAPAPELARAKRQTGNILGRAGLRVNWGNCRADARNSHDSGIPYAAHKLFLRMIPGRSHSMGDSIFGVAFLSATEAGVQRHLLSAQPATAQRLGCRCGRNYGGHNRA
jgi:hypothetical protein